jgi:hypothetical protein
MFRNYFITAWRSVMKNKSFFFITGIGITTSLALLSLLQDRSNHPFDNFTGSTKEISIQAPIGVGPVGFLFWGY